MHPGTAPQGTTVTGDTVESDQGRRLLSKVRDKCAKTQGAGTAWIWVEDHSGLFHFPTPFAGMSLAAKTDALAELLGPLLEEYVHVAGIIVSNAARRRLPLPRTRTHPVPPRRASGGGCHSTGSARRSWFLGESFCPTRPV